ncbi:MAG TPA: penicillin-binding protein activator [Caulobacterales bacterium]|nr:penicillin-binding protein activator [Caulobacterales bacterium]
MSGKRSSSDARVAPSLKAAALLTVATALGACATSGTQTPVAGPPASTPPPATVVQTREGVTPPFMAGRPIVRVGLLLPFSLRATDASALYNAAELALFDHGDRNTLLIPRDAGADAASAQAAARALINDGADIIIGPVLADAVQSAGREARGQNIPVIGFSSDRTVAGDGIYLLSFQLEDEVSRIVTYAAAHNVRTIALLAPSNEYGRRVESALREAAAANGVGVTAAQLYNRTDAEAAAAATALARSFGPTPPQALLVAESGSALRVIGPALVAGGADLHRIRLLGTSAWAGGDAEREPTLAGGWYVSPDPGARTDFESRYQSVFQKQPTRLASLAYDAVALASALSHDRGAQGFSRAQLENSEGFLGSDGIFRFRANGTIERGLAIMEVRAGASVAVDPAPRRFARSGT